MFVEITKNGVWCSKCKHMKGDIAEMSDDDGELLKKRKFAKKTNAKTACLAVDREQED